MYYNRITDNMFVTFSLETYKQMRKIYITIIHTHRDPVPPVGVLTQGWQKNASEVYPNTA